LEWAIPVTHTFYFLVLVVKVEHVLGTTSTAYFKS